MIFLTFLVHVLQLKEVVSGLFDVNDNKQEFLLYRAMWDNSQHCWVKVNKMHDVLFVKSVQWMIGKDKYFCLSTASYIKEQNWKSNADTNIHYLYVFFFLQTHIDIFSSITLSITARIRQAKAVQQSLWRIWVAMALLLLFLIPITEKYNIAEEKKKTKKKRIPVNLTL